MGYEKINTGHPAYARIAAIRASGQFACDALNHNATGGCPNPECFNFTMTQPTFAPPTERLRITECKADYLSRTKRKITIRAIAEVAFKGMRITPKRRGELLSFWDAGTRLHEVNERVLNGMAEALGCTVQDLTGE